MRKQLSIAISIAAFTLLALGTTAQNIAREATITTSGDLRPDCSGKCAADGLVRLFDKGEWLSTAAPRSGGYCPKPWIKFEWKEARYINKVIIYDRPNPYSHAAGGDLEFSDGSIIPVFAIPNNGAPKEVVFPPKKVSWVRMNFKDVEGRNYNNLKSYHIGLSEMEIYLAEESMTDYVSRVNPFTETAQGRYFFFATGSQPFGMISAAPMTRNKNMDGGGYNYNFMDILGFPQIHDWMISGINLMPTTGDLPEILNEDAWKSPFTHEGEIAQPGYHRIYLEKYNLWVEQTAADRISMYRITYTGKENTMAKILCNLGGFTGNTTMADARVTKKNDYEIEGTFNSKARNFGGPESVKVYFILKFDRPMAQMDSWDDSTFTADAKELDATGHRLTPRYKNPNAGKNAPSSGVSANYPMVTGGQVQYKCALSYTSMENARKNMASETQDWDFDKLRAASQKEWNEYLGRIDVKGGTSRQRTKFYTDLWHVLLGRHKIDDYTGDYPDYTQGKRVGNATVDIKYRTLTLPKDKNGKPLHHMYNSDSFWLTQWNLNILWGLAWPEVQDDFAACLVQYSENGGLLPRGPNIGGYTYIMTCCPATPLITSAYQKGILTKTDPEKAYEHMKKNHEGGGMLGTEEEISCYVKNGYYPSDAGKTLEASFQDWSLGQMALKMGKKKDYNYYNKRSGGWTALYNPEQKLIFPKTKDGQWLHTNPIQGSGWVEANAWQATWSVSHDIDRLAELMGGKAELCKKLNYAFVMSEPQSFIYRYGEGRISYTNQPGCSNAHVFNYAGAPELSQYWVRQVAEKTYGAITPDRGYGGHDEDQGQMGGVSALMAMGLFSLKGTCSIEPVYEITSPVFDEITIQLSHDYYSGKEFKIKTYNNSKANCYIQKKRLNGQPLDNFWFYHKDFTKGGLLEIYLGNQPAKK